MFEKSRKVFKVSKKIKRKYTPCEVSKEDTKEYWRRVKKSTNYDNRMIKGKLGWVEQEEFY